MASDRIETGHDGLDSLIREVMQFRGMEGLGNYFLEIDTAVAAIKKIVALGLTMKDRNTAVEALQKQILENIRVINQVAANKAQQLNQNVSNRASSIMSRSSSQSSVSYHGESRGFVGRSG